MILNGTGSCSRPCSSPFRCPILPGQLGWVVAEVGRQPWIVYGVLKTADAVSKTVSTFQVIGSLLGFTVLYGGLAVLDIYLLVKYSKKGPR